MHQNRLAARWRTHSILKIPSWLEVNPKKEKGRESDESGKKDEMRE